VSKRIKGSTGAARPPKRVIEAPRESGYRHLVWRFGRLDYEGQFACQTLDLADIPDLERELQAFQREPIHSLRQRHWLKYIPGDEMTSDGRKRLAEVSEQEDGLWQLDLQRNKWRIWGYFEDPEFYFLWWDGGHAVATGRSRRRRSQRAAPPENTHIPVRYPRMSTNLRRLVEQTTRLGHPAARVAALLAASPASLADACSSNGFQELRLTKVQRVAKPLGPSLSLDAPALFAHDPSVVPRMTRRANTLAALAGNCHPRFRRRAHGVLRGGPQPHLSREGAEHER